MDNVWRNRLVPILAVVDLPHEEDPPITGMEQILATRYYLRVYTPDRGRAGIVLPTRYDIPMAGVTAGVARLLLPPSIGYGVNASYRVEYIAWRPIINGVKVLGQPLTGGKVGGTRPRVRVPERVIREEYWKVPHTGRRLMRMQLVHAMDRDPIPAGILNPVSVTALDGRPLQWDIIEHPLQGTHDKSLRDITITVNLPIGGEYVIEYMAPLSLRDVVLNPTNRTYTEDICPDSFPCCPPLTAPWVHSRGMRGISTPWYY
jgi:hypothetical protein